METVATGQLSMKPTPSPDAPEEPIPAAAVVLAAVLGVIAVLACGVPFVRPLVFVAVPLASGSFLLLVGVFFRGVRWTTGRAISALIALALDGFALFLALGHHHLIDWLEGL